MTFDDVCDETGRVLKNFGDLIAAIECQCEGGNVGGVQWGFLG